MSARRLALGEPCERCGGSGRVAHPSYVAWVRGRGPYHRLLWLTCPSCEHVRAAQRRLNRDAAARLAHGIKLWFLIDESGEPLRPCSLLKGRANVGSGGTRCVRAMVAGVELKRHVQRDAQCDPPWW